MTDNDKENGTITWQTVVRIMRKNMPENDKGNYQEHDTTLSEHEKNMTDTDKEIDKEHDINW